MNLFFPVVIPFYEEPWFIPAVAGGGAALVFVVLLLSILTCCRCCRRRWHSGRSHASHMHITHSINFSYSLHVSYELTVFLISHF